MTHDRILSQYRSVAGSYRWRSTIGPHRVHIWVDPMWTLPGSQTNLYRYELGTNLLVTWYAARFSVYGRDSFEQHHAKMSSHRFTYPKCVHSYRYFLQPMHTANSLPPAHAYSAILLLTLSWERINCKADNRRIWRKEVPVWVYAFWVCKPVLKGTSIIFYGWRIPTGVFLAWVFLPCRKEKKWNEICL